MSLIPAEEAYNQSIEVCNKSSEDFMGEIERLITRCIKDGRSSFIIAVDNKITDDALRDAVDKLKELHYDAWVETILWRELHVSFKPKEKINWIKRIFGE